MTHLPRSINCKNVHELVPQGSHPGASLIIDLKIKLDVFWLFRELLEELLPIF